MAGGHGWDALPPPPWGRDGGGAPWLTAVAGSLPPVPSRAGPCVPCGPATRPAPAASKRERRPGMSSSLQRPTTSPRVSAGGRRAVCVQGNIYVWGASLHGVGWGRGQGVEGQSAGGTLGEIHGGGVRGCPWVRGLWGRQCGCVGGGSTWGYGLWRGGCYTLSLLSMQTPQSMRCRGLLSGAAVGLALWGVCFGGT